MTSILIVEDNAVVGRLLVRYLQIEGFNVLAVLTSAEEALAQLKEAVEVNIVVTDMALPGMNGIEFVIQLSQSHPQLPCIMLSTTYDSHTVAEALKQGAKGYVRKRDPLALIEGIKQVLDGEIYVSG